MRGWSSLFLLHLTYIYIRPIPIRDVINAIFGTLCDILHCQHWSAANALAICSQQAAAHHELNGEIKAKSAVSCGERDSAAERPYYWPFRILKVFYTQRGCDWHNICHAPGARIVCSAFHSIKAVVSQVTALRTGLQTCGINCKGHTLVPVCHPGTPTVSGSVTAQGWLA